MSSPSTPDRLNTSLVEPKRPLDFVARVYSDLTVVLLIPVSITIFACVWGVENLTPLYANKNESPLFLVAGEGGGGQSPAKKFQASLLNALMIVAMILVATVLIVVLYKLRCMKAIIGWLLLSAAMIFFFLAWVWIDLICTKYQIPYDLVTVSIVLWNFGVVGIISVFYYAHPKFQQGYLVILSVIMAWMLSRLPEWTTWAILIAVALYDICVVLCPNGPLKMLVEESKKRDEPIPGFVYDSSGDAINFHPSQTRPATAGSTPAGAQTTAAMGGVANQEREGNATATPATERRASGATTPKAAAKQECKGDGKDNAAHPSSPKDATATNAKKEEEEEEEEPDPFDAAEHASPFRLGLGDFIFYSVLVARAAYFSYVSWMTCYVCVSMGLIGTLSSLLFLRGKVPALPALPISIFLGVIGFFLSRYVMVPFAYFMITTASLV